jgi:uncharacterized protein YjbI with pentapeptide repeats
MRISMLLIAVLWSFCCWVSPVFAANPEQVTQLLESRACVGCDLQGADLQQSDLRGVDLTRADLRNANLSEAQMMAVNLTEAKLQGADLTNAQAFVVNLTGANLEGAKVDGIDPVFLKLCHTIDPEGKLLDWDCEE